MYLRNLTTIKFSMCVLAALTLAGCGGGGGDGTMPGPTALPLEGDLLGHGLPPGEVTVAPGESSTEHGHVRITCPADGAACVLNIAADGTVTPGAGGVPMLEILPLTVRPGQNRSDVPPVYATNETSTLKATLANPANVIPALATSVNRDRELGTALGTVLFVKSIRRNANGEYVVDYVLDGADGQVTIPNDSAHCSTISCRVTEDGRTFLFWARTDGEDRSRQDGLDEFEYLAAHILSSRHRTWFVFGVRNADLPLGTATYHGKFEASSWSATDRDLAMRQRLLGTMRIVANFDMRALNGRVYQVSGTPVGGGAYSPWETSSFMLTNGRIVDGQFTATLTGVDSDPNPSLSKSVKYFMGDVLGEFYGPNAEEVGGVVTATRTGTTDDRVLNGHIAGRKTDRLTGVTDSEALLTGVDRNHEADSTTLTAVERPTVETTDDGFRITYVVDGQTQTVELNEDDFGAIRHLSYSKKADGTETRFTSRTSSFTRSRLFTSFRPEHFDVSSWGIYHHDSSDKITSSSYSHWIYGSRTMDMPTSGTASYAGSLSVAEWPSDKAVSTVDSSFTWYRGDLSLTADFGGSTVVGNSGNLDTRPGRGDWVRASGGLSFNATINGNGLSANDLSGSGVLAGYGGGRVDGAFYGPGAAEVAGVFKATHDTDNKLVTGYFGGQKQ